jgi:hypothetical protein
MQRGTVQAIPATFPETLTTPSKIAQKASLLDMLNDICVSQACAESPRHRIHGTPPHTRHTPRRTACKIQPLGQRVRLRQSAAAPRVLCVLTVRCAHCRSSGLPRPRRATSTRSSCARRTHALSALRCRICSAVQCSGGAVAASADFGGCVFARTPSAAQASDRREVREHEEHDPPDRTRQYRHCSPPLRPAALLTAPGAAEAL